MRIRIDTGRESVGYNDVGLTREAVATCSSAKNADADQAGAIAEDVLRGHNDMLLTQSIGSGSSLLSNITGATVAASYGFFAEGSRAQQNLSLKEFMETDDDDDLAASSALSDSAPGSSGKRDAASEGGSTAGNKGKKPKWWDCCLMTTRACRNFELTMSELRMSIAKELAAASAAINDFEMCEEDNKTFASELAIVANRKRALEHVADDTGADTLAAQTRLRARF